MQEGLVEIGHRFAFAEPGKESIAVDTVESSDRPFQHFHQAQGLQPARVRDCWNNARSTGARRCQTASCQLKATAGAGVWRAHRTQAEKNAIKECLHQGRPEKGGTAVTLKANAQRFLQSRPQCGQRRRFAGPFHPRQPVPGVGRQQPGHVLRLGQRSRMGQHPAQVLAQAGANLVGQGPWPF